MKDTNDAQTIIRSQVDHYLDTLLIEDLSIRRHLMEVTAAGDEDKSYLPTGRVTVTIVLANGSGLRSPTLPGGLSADAGPEGDV